MTSLALANASALLNTPAALSAPEQAEPLFPPSPELLCVAGTDGFFKSLNPAFEQTLGYTAYELLARPLIDFVHPDDRAGTLALLAQLADHATAIHFENRYRHTDGTYRWLQWTARPLLDKDLFYAVARDVTEHKNAEEAVRHQQERMRLLYEIMSQTGRTIDEQVYEALKRITSLLRLETGLLSRVLDDTYLIETCYAPDRDLAPAQESVLAETFCTITLEDDDVVAIDHMGQSPFRDHPAYHLLGFEAYIGIPIKIDGTLFGTLSFSSTRPQEPAFTEADRDTIRLLSRWVSSVLERKQAIEAIAQKAEALQRSNEELEQFAYVASHDLQEPLRTISSFVQLLQERYEGELDADADDFIGFIVGAAERMQALIHDLLTYSRVGTREIERKRIDTHKVLLQTLAGMQTTLEATGAEVTFEKLPKIKADATQLSLVLQNLISNGIKFRGKAPPHVHIEANKIDGCWRFAVRDNGIGIKKKYQDRIFEIFRRLHSWSQYTGTGIGLAICKKIVERHGGRLWVESESDRGATFYFTIPA